MSARILIIDDDLDTLRLVGLMLQRQGYQISAATNAQQGLDKAFDEDPDLILLDVMMPEIDGYETARRLRANPSTKETPILMFTAKSQASDRTRGFEVGVNDYLSKPTHPSELQARVKALLEQAGKEKNDRAAMPKNDNRGFVVGLIGARGGLGTTTIALNLAAGLQARLRSDVILAETLPGRGALALELGLDASYGLTDLLSRTKPADITPGSVRAALQQGSSSVKVLLASDRPRDMNLIGQNANYRTIVSMLSELARFVILDLGASLQPFTQALLPYCDELFVVLEGNPNAVVTAKALIEDLQAFGAPDQNIHAILNNRILSDSLPLTSQVQEKLGRAIVAALSPAPDLFLQATRLQSPVVLSQAGSLTARQFNKLIDFIIEREALPR